MTDFLNKLKSVQDGLLKLDHNVINQVSAYEKLEHDIAMGLDNKGLKNKIEKCIE